MVHPLRVMLGPWEEVGGVGPGYVAPGSVGGPHLRVMVNVEVGVRGGCLLRVPLTLRVLLVSRGGPSGVLTSGGVDARGACEYGGHTELHKHVLPGSRYFLVSKFSKANKTWVQKDGLVVKKKEKIRDASGYVCFTAHIVIHIHPYAGYSIRPLEPPGYR